AVLMLPIFAHPIAWMIIRVLMGICMAGLYATTESWMHDKADNVTRGRLIATFQLVQYIGQMTGQQAIRLASPTEFMLFSLAASWIALSVLPLAFTRSDPPHPPPVPRLRLIWLYRISPVAVAAVFIAGLANGTIWALMPVYAKLRGFDTGGVATVVAFATIGAAASQWPAGRISDHFDRRLILLIAMIAAVIVQVLVVLFPSSNLLVVSTFMFFVGAASLVIYTLATSHAADRAGRENMVEISSGLLLTYTFGAIVGPTLAAAMMQWISPEAMFIHNAFFHSLLAIFVIWRLRKRPN
ncbi:MAG: MFS transporter, partial [Pseudorhodoplanes sp.]